MLLDYPDEKVLNESLDKRFSTVHSRQLVLNFLTSELMAEKLIAKNKAQVISALLIMPLNIIKHL